MRGGGGEGGGPCVDRSHLQPHTCCYPGVQFNLLARFLIPGPSTAPVPAGNWGAELRGSSVSRTSQRRLRCVHLLTPILSKCDIPFYLPWFDSIGIAQLGLPSLAFRPLKEQMEKLFLLAVTVLTVLVFFSFRPSQELFHWLVFVRICTSISKIDVNYGIDLTIP